jgi:hypothetical protein
MSGSSRRRLAAHRAKDALKWRNVNHIWQKSNKMRRQVLINETFRGRYEPDNDAAENP